MRKEEGFIERGPKRNFVKRDEAIINSERPYKKEWPQIIRRVEGCSKTNKQKNQQKLMSVCHDVMMFLSLGLVCAAEGVPHRADQR